MTRNLKPVGAAVRSLLLLLLCLGIPVRSEALATYEERTQAALAELAAAEAAAQSGDAAETRAALDGIGRSLSGLASQANAFRELADRERERCVEGVAGLDRRVGDLLVQADEVGRQIAELDASLAAITERRQTGERAVEDLSNRLHSVETALAEHNRKLQELNDWWWVPFYGAYLGIRTLVDHDVEEANSLIATINDQRSRLSRIMDDIRAAQALRLELDGQRRQHTETHARLARMREETAARMGELRSTVAFLASAEMFWGKAEQIVRIRAGDHRADLELLVDMLESDLTLTDFTVEFAPTSKSLGDALVDFARSVDARTNFLLDGSTDYCGGPALSDRASIPSATVVRR